MPVRSPYKISTPLYLLYSSIGLAVTCWGFHSIFERPLPEQLAAAGQSQFLTNLSLALTIITIVSNIIAAVLPKINVLYTVNKYLNACALICETLVALIYWFLKIFLLALIVPENVPKDKFIPLKLDLSIHLFPITFLSIDYYFIRVKNFDIPQGVVLALVVSLSAGYWAWLEKVVVPPAHYPYPFLNVETQERAKIFFAVAVAGFGFYNIYEYIHKLINRAKKTFDEKKEL